MVEYEKNYIIIQQFPSWVKESLATVNFENSKTIGRTLANLDAVRMEKQKNYDRNKQFNPINKHIQNAQLRKMSVHGGSTNTYRRKRTQYNNYWPRRQEESTYKTLRPYARSFARYDNISDENINTNSYDRNRRFNSNYQYNTQQRPQGYNQNNQMFGLDGNGPNSNSRSEIRNNPGNGSLNAHTLSIAGNKYQTDRENAQSNVEDLNS